MHIRWENTTTFSFFVSNGVKQGGILSPILFNVYMDQLSVKLNASNIWGDVCCCCCCCCDNPVHRAALLGHHYKYY